MRFSILGDTEMFKLPHDLIVGSLAAWIGLRPGECQVCDVICWLDLIKRWDENWATCAVRAPFGDIMEIEVIRHDATYNKVFLSFPPTLPQLKIPKHIRASRERLREIRDELASTLIGRLQKIELDHGHTCVLCSLKFDNWVLYPGAQCYYKVFACSEHFDLVSLKAKQAIAEQKAIWLSAAVEEMQRTPGVQGE